MSILNLGFLVSHSGSNMQAIIDNVKTNNLTANLCVLISNNRSSFALERANIEKIPAFVINDSTHPNGVDEEIVRLLKSYGVDTVILAGYMKLVSRYLIDSFNGRVLNIHPALLPKFGGKGMYGINVHRSVIESGEQVSGATVHLVSSKYDRGKILQQKECSVNCGYETPDTLAAKVLEIEHSLYSDTLIKISKGEIII